MNLLFSLVFLLSCFLLLISNPEGFLSALLEGGKQGAVICCALIGTYSVWMGLIKVWEDSGVSKIFSKLLKPLVKKLFHTEDKETLEAVSMNLSVNLLGISGAATPYGIKAASLLDKGENAEYTSALFFILNATSIQLIPTSIIGVRTALHSAAPADIVLPTIIVSFLSTFLACLLVRLFIPPKSKKKCAQKIGVLQKNKGACI
jgi:spore maturation protein A